MTAKKSAASSARKRSSPARASARQDSQLGTESATRKRSVAEHSEHPENPADSTVRHARPSTRDEAAGEKGFPVGEYDVTEPAAEGAKPKAGKKERVYSVKEAHLLALGAGKDVKAIQAALKAPNANRLSKEERAVAAELLPVGALIEHEATNRWRVRGPLGQGGPHFGHGATLAEAIDSYVLGNIFATDAEASAHRFSNLSPRQQKEIEERDNKALESVGGAKGAISPEVLQRRENVANAQAASKRLASPINAQSDGAEVGSAVNEAGRERGERNRTQAAGRVRSTGTSRSRSRSGASSR